MARTGRLDVFLLGIRVGSIDYSSHHNEMHFAYSPEYLTSSDATPLSYPLPLQSDAFDSERTTELKYESEGGPSFRSCMVAMADMRIALADRLAFIDRMIFNYLIGNADAHGKNSSVLYRGHGGISLAPVYDVMCTAI